ncbi:pirin family protein [Vibrio sp. TH_r3]|uniref:pirin family protein n=1 Tax=Vibrio sp. TH_r3 TaxID=3082084 RepID=UPI002955DBBC|nr:pirin family protein [Vibrio sp. TH_r3]MDV7104650.1 pirin family protein [Vibrio sp. TH_r3]
MKYIRKAQDRGVVDFGWLQSKHSFSFGSYYDPNHVGVSVLRVINDDTVMPGKGFGEHAHNDMEIISYVIEGALKHKDSTGNSYAVPAGDVQRMSAGRGVTHSEFNASNTDKVKFLQIWIEPNVSGIEPSYEQKSFPKKDNLTLLVSQNGDDGSLSINQNVMISRLVLEKNQNISLCSELGMGYLHLIKGQIMVDGQVFNQGDAFTIEPDKTLVVKADTSIEALWFDLPLV